MTVQAQSADGVVHQFPDGTDRAVIDKVMKRYAFEKRGSEGFSGFTRAAQRGLAASVLGAPGDIEPAALSVATAGAAPLLQKYIPALGKNPFPTTSDMERILPGKMAGEAHPIGQFIGEMIPGLVPGSMALKGATKAISGTKAGEVLSRLKPGAPRVAEEAGRAAVGKVADIAPVTDVSKVGENILADTRPKYQAMLEQRDKKVLNAFKRLGALRGNEEQKALAAQRIYRTESAGINKWMENSLGRKLAANEGKYASDAAKLRVREAKIDAHDVGKQAFKSRESVKDLRELLEETTENQPKTEKHAADYVSQHVYTMTHGKTAGEAAKAVDKFSIENRDWLNEVPKTKDALQIYKSILDSHDNVQKTIAKTRSHAKWGAGLAATAAIFSEGYHAWSWLRHELGL